MEFKLSLILFDRNLHYRETSINHDLLSFLTFQAAATEGQEANVITDYILKVMLQKDIQ